MINQNTILRKIMAASFVAALALGSSITYVEAQEGTLVQESSSQEQLRFIIENNGSSQFLQTARSIEGHWNFRVEKVIDVNGVIVLETQEPTMDHISAGMVWKEDQLFAANHLEFQNLHISQDQFTYLYDVSYDRETEMFSHFVSPHSTNPDQLTVNLTLFVSPDISTRALSAQTGARNYWSYDYSVRFENSGNVLVLSEQVQNGMTIEYHYTRANL